MVNYMAKLIANLSTLNAPLRHLLHSKDDFIWTEVEKQSFEKIISELSEKTVLKYLDLNKPIVLENDCSSYGMGSVLMQDGMPVFYSSRSLTKAERNYSPMEKELLAVVFACKRNDSYIIGNKDVTVKTDHKPLIKIMKKPIHIVTKRLQAMLMELQRYRIKLVYHPGKEMFLSDTLSRAPVPEDSQNYVHNYDMLKIESEKAWIKELTITKRVEGMPISDERLEHLRKFTAEDQELIKLKEVINNGWPTKIQNVDNNIKCYHKYKNELSEEDGLLFKDDRIIVPCSLRREYVERLHGSHNGVVATLNLAKDTVFWPGITNQIKNKIENCKICLESSSLQQKQPMQSHQTPSVQFEQVSMDIFDVTLADGKHNYLVLIDHYSDFFELLKMKDMTSETVVEWTSEQFARHGIPKKVTTDNGPCFNSKKFREFATKFEFVHSMSSPYHQQANGKAEACVKVAKNLLKKADKSNSNFWLSLLNHRNTANKIESSPAQRLYSRRTRCQIPIKENKLKAS